MCLAVLSESTGANTVQTMHLDMLSESTGANTVQTAALVIHRHQQCKLQLMLSTGTNTVQTTAHVIHRGQHSANCSSYYQNPQGPTQCKLCILVCYQNPQGPTQCKLCISLLSESTGANTVQTMHLAVVRIHRGQHSANCASCCCQNPQGQTDHYPIHKQPKLTSTWHKNSDIISILWFVYVHYWGADQAHTTALRNETRLQHHCLNSITLRSALPTIPWTQSPWDRLYPQLCHKNTYKILISCWILKI